MTKHEKTVLSDRLELIEVVDNEKYYVFHPRLTRLFPKSGDMRTMNLREILLFLSRFVHGYKVYILTDDNDTVKGSIVISGGGQYRYPFATKKDLIDGPSFTVPAYRGQGVAYRLGDAILNRFENSYENVYGIIAEKNEASLNRVRKNGYDILYRIKVDRLRRFYKDEKGTTFLVVYRRNREKPLS